MTPPTSSRRSQTIANWSLVGAAALAFCALISVSPARPIYDEPWFLDTIVLFKQRGFTVDFFREFPGAPGPTFTIVYALIDRVLGLAFPWNRFISFTLLIAATFLMWRILKMTLARPRSGVRRAFPKSRSKSRAACRKFHDASDRRVVRRHDPDGNADGPVHGRRAVAPRQNHRRQDLATSAHSGRLGMRADDGSRGAWTPKLHRHSAVFIARRPLAIRRAQSTRHRTDGLDRRSRSACGRPRLSAVGRIHPAPL